jgi:hypothetical protein
VIPTIQDVFGRTLSGGLVFAKSSSQLLFMPNEPADGGVAFDVWDIATGTSTRQVIGPQPDQSYEKNK